MNNHHYIPIEDISGLVYIDNFITEEEQDRLISFLDQDVRWSNDISRRTIQYGFKYSYKHQAIVSKVDPIPEELHFVRDRINDQFYPKDNQINQMIVNEYIGLKQGIKKHTDFKDFGPIISSLSLLNPCVMLFYENVNSNAVDDLADHGRIAKLVLKPRSLLVMKDGARYNWKHEIPKIKEFKKLGIQVDSIQNIRDSDYRRVSLTFRTMNPLII